MPEYRRANILGAMYFFTVVTHRRRRILTEDMSRSLLRMAFRKIQQKYPFTIEGIVILPDHLHTLWRLPEGNSRFSLRWRLIKSDYASEYIKITPGLSGLSDSRQKKGERVVWQRRYWEHLIRDDGDFERHLDTIHYNPIKHGYVQSPHDWEWSSLHRYVERGWNETDWGDTCPAGVNDVRAGE